MDGRPVDVSSHNVFYRGFFHGFVIHDGRNGAMVEGESGTLSFVDLSYHSLKFTDREQAAQL